MSLFARLFKYRPSEGRSPQEDFLTEALAGVLESSFPLRAAFVNWLVECDLDFERVRVETQKSAGSYGRLDLWLEAQERSGERHVVVFENKIEAPEGEGQLQSYERYLGERPEPWKSRTLIYLTRHTRSDSPRGDQSVAFQNLRWFEVFHWFKAWTKGPDTEARLLVNELLDLMEEWNLTMELNANDLAAALVHRSSVEQRMVSLLNEVWSVCRIDGSQTNKWKYEYRFLYYRSPNIVDGGNLYFRFGFDFHREDEHWSVSGLQLPSAYVTIIGEHDEKRLPCGWTAPTDSWVDAQPDNWRWKNAAAASVKQLSVLAARGAALNEAYLGFFKQALEEAESAVEPV